MPSHRNHGPGSLQDCPAFLNLYWAKSTRCKCQILLATHYSLLDHKTENNECLDDHKHINSVCLYPLLWSRRMLWSCTDWHHGLVCGLSMCYLALCFSTVCWDPELGWPDVLILLELSLETFRTVHTKQLAKWNNAKYGTKAWATEPAIYCLRPVVCVLTSRGNFSLQQLQVFICTSFAIGN